RWNIKHYSFARALKQEVTENALRSGGMRNLFSDGIRIDGAGFMQTNGNVLALPDWVQFDEDAPMDDPDCPLGKQRALLQFWGTQLRRGADPDYWVKKVEAQMSKDLPDVALLSDLRFLNEMQWVQRYGECVRIDRLGLPPATHESELALANIPADCWSDAIKTNGTLEELKEKVLFSFDSLMSAIPQDLEQKAA